MCRFNSEHSILPSYRPGNLRFYYSEKSSFADSLSGQSLSNPNPSDRISTRLEGILWTEGNSAWGFLILRKAECTDIALPQSVEILRNSPLSLLECGLR